MLGSSIYVKWVTAAEESSAFEMIQRYMAKNIVRELSSFLTCISTHKLYNTHCASAAAASSAAR